MRCDDLTLLAPELALGTLDGVERADALRHLATCAQCRREVDELTEVVDELLLIAPAQEPPAGFETRALDALGFEQRGAPRTAWRRRLAWLAPPVAAAAVTAAVLAGVFHDDHVTAGRYRATLAQAGGRAFQSSALRDGAGAAAGVCFGYQGKPSWMLVTVDAAHRDQVRSAEIVTRDHRTIPLRGFALRPDGSWGGAIPVDLSEVAAMRLLGDQPGEVLQAYVT